MLGINSSTIVGNVGSDPESRKLPNSDTTVCNFSVAVNDRYTSNDKKVERTEWVSVVCYGKLAEAMKNNLKKGAPLYVNGKLRTRSWEDKTHSDITHHKTEIIAETVRFLPNSNGKNTN